MKRFNLPVPPVLEKELYKLIKGYENNDLCYKVIRALAFRRGYTINIEKDPEGFKEFLLNNLIYLVIILKELNVCISETLIEQLEKDDIYKGMRIKYRGGNLVGEKTFSTIIDEVLE